jgi:hypothetical protein
MCTITVKGAIKANSVSKHATKLDEGIITGNQTAEDRTIAEHYYIGHKINTKIEIEANKMVGLRSNAENGGG